MEQVGFCKVAFEDVASSFDYEFLNSDTNELKFDLENIKREISKLSEIEYLYFREFDDECFVEVVTGRNFKPLYLEENNKKYYYNKESGLYLLPKTMYYASKKESEKGIYDNEYSQKVNKFFNLFIRLEKKDTMLVSKVQRLLLLENKTIVK